MSADSKIPEPRSRAPAPYVSTGRGGAGNMRPSSRPRNTDSHHANSGPEDYSPSRGRDVPAQNSEKVSLKLARQDLLPNDTRIHRMHVPSTRQQRLFGSGRGGIGNVHSPSSGAAIETRNALREEAKYVRENVRGGIPVSHGRGGAGNFSFSRSRSRSQARKQESHFPEIPVGTSTEVAVAEGTYGAANGSKERTSTERASHGQENNHSSGVSKITKLFRRGSRDAPRLSPELPEQ